MKEIRTRFAPSPTGYLHIGGIRTNFFSWLLARHHGGKFILRIEDTDRERLVPGAIQSILEDLRWLDIDIDEGPAVDELEQCDASWEGATGLGGDYGPYVQSLRRERYQEIAGLLIEKGVAFRCDCTPEMLKKEREEQLARKETTGYGGRCRDRKVSADSNHVVRFRIPDDCSLSMDDAIRGRINWESLSLRDTVIMKSDGFPTYHLAVVVDDHDMEITHVMRGEEWIATAPIHVMLYQALGWELPIFCHLPSVLGADGKKLSKRHGATHIRAFREDGYLPEALLNFVSLIGWSPGDGDEQEIFTRKELVEKFTLDRVNAASGIFEYSKLDWMNGVYIRNLDPKDLAKKLKPFLENAGQKVDQVRLEAIVPHIQDRLKKLTDAAPLVEFLFSDEIERDIEAMFNEKKGIGRPEVQAILEGVLTEFQALEAWSAPGVEEALKTAAEKLELKPGPVFISARIAVTGKKSTPPLAESIEVLGKDAALKRVKRTIHILSNAD